MHYWSNSHIEHTNRDCKWQSQVPHHSEALPVTISVCYWSNSQIEYVDHDCKRHCEVTTTPRHSQWPCKCVFPSVYTTMYLFGPVADDFRILLIKQPYWTYWPTIVNDNAWYPPLRGLPSLTHLVCLFYSLADDFGGEGNSFHGVGGRGNKRAQMRHCIRLIHSMVSTGIETVLQDFMDQGAITQITGQQTNSPF